MVDQLVITLVVVRLVQRGVAVETILLGSGISATGHEKMKAKRERALTALMTFKKFNPPIFDGETVDP